MAADINLQRQQVVVVVGQIEGFHTKLDQFGFAEANLLHDRRIHGELLRPIDEGAFHVAGFTGWYVEEDLVRKGWLARTIRSQTGLGAIRIDRDLQHARVDVVKHTIVVEASEQVSDLGLRQVGVWCLSCRTRRAIQRSAVVRYGNRPTAADVNDRRNLEPAEDPVNDATLIQETFATTERQFINAVKVEGMRLIEISATVFKTRVRIVELSEQRGRIEIEYYSQADLDRLYQQIVGR